MNKYYLQAILAIVLAFAVTASASAQNPKPSQPSLGEENAQRTTDNGQQSTDNGLSPTVKFL